MNDRALKVLEQYDLEVRNVRRGRGSYIFDTPQGLRILADYTGSENKARFQNCLLERIREGGYQKVDRILPDREGNLIVRDWEEKKYVVKEWYAGRECDTANEAEIMAAVTNLARLHCLMFLDGEQAEAFAGSFTAQPQLAELHAANAELRKVRSFMRKRNAKGDFERLFLKCFDSYYAQASEAEELLARAEGQPESSGQPAWAGGIQAKNGQAAQAGGAQTGRVSSLQEGKMQMQGVDSSSGSSAVLRAVCHGDYDHHHVLLSAGGMATTGFECCRFDDQVTDLYRFMRKILEKQDWSPQLGMRMLETYTKTRPLCREERSLLYVRMLYPEKFRKLANHYYGGNKAWISRRFLDKLEVLNRQQEKRNNFVKMLK